jgi:hypothetical protein
VPNTLIETTWANPTLSDVAASITDSLDRYGRGGMLAQLKLADGTVGAPAFAFNSEASTGLLRPSSGVLNVAVLASIVASFTAAGMAVTGTLTTSGGITQTAGNSQFNTLTMGTATPIANVRITVVGDTPFTNVMTATGYGGQSAITLRTAGGTIAAPSATPAGTVATLAGSTTSDGINFFNTALLQFIAEGAPVAGSHPTAVGIFTTPAGSTARVERVRVDSVGRFIVGTVAPSLTVAGVEVQSGPVRVRGAINPLPLTTSVELGTIAGFPVQTLINTAGAVDTRAWVNYADNTQLHFSLHNDAFSAGNDWLTVTRSGTALTSAVLAPLNVGGVGIGVSPSNGFKLDVNGGIRARGSIAPNTGVAGIAIGTGGTGGELLFTDPTAPADQKFSDILSTPNSVIFRLLTDSFGAANAYMQVARTGASVANLIFPGGIVGVGAVPPAGYNFWAGGNIGGVTNIGGSSDSSAYTIYAGLTPSNGGYLQIWGSSSPNPNLLILGGNGASRLLIDTVGRINTPAIHNNPSGASGGQYLASGTYTPTGTNVSNCSSVIPTKAQFVRVGNVVHVTGACAVTVAVAGTGTIYRLSLPVASNLAVISDLSGAATSISSGGGAANTVQADVTNDQAVFSFNGPGFTGGINFTYSYSYEVL